MGNFDDLRTSIAEVIKQNGNEEITGDVLQFILLEMVSGLGAGYRFLGTCNTQTEPQEPDGAAFYIGGAGEYLNFNGISPTVADGYVCFFKWDGSAWSYSLLKVSQPVDDEITDGGQNPVKGGAIYDEFQKLRAAGYLFAGVATPLTDPGVVTERVFCLATAAGEYSNFGEGFTLPYGLSILLFDGQDWSKKNLFELGEIFTAEEKQHLDNIPTATELQEALNGKQDELTIDSQPVEGSNNPISSNAVYAIAESVAAIVEMFEDYYTKTETDEALAGVKGELADVSMTLSKDVVKTGESTTVVVRVESNIEATAIVLKRDGSVIAQGSGKVLQFSDTVNESQAGSIGYTVELSIGGVDRTADATLDIVNPVYYGAALSVSDVATQATARKAPAGRYEMTADEDESSIFILVPVGMSVNSVEMGGIEMPMEAPTGIFIGAAQYLSYQSSNTYDAGDYVINVY